MKRAVLAFLAGALALTAGGVLLAQPGVIMAPPDGAIIIVKAPADATVSIGGQVSAQKGPERRFITGTPLVPGSKYYYEVVATWKVNGKTKKEQQKVTFRPGDIKTVSFPKPAGKAKKQPEKKKETGTKKEPAKKKTTAVWTDPHDPTLPPSFRIQGEYVSEGKDGKFGCQVIALGSDQLQAVVLPGGLPGAGWNGKDKSLMQGHVEGDRAVFTPATGKRRYLAGPPSEFSATSKFPPVGQKNYSGSADGKTMSISDNGKTIHLKKIERKSPTLRQKAPSGAVILFDGTNMNEWTGSGRFDKAHGVINTGSGGVLTKKRFNNYTVHLEFLLPFVPAARGQERGNSGFYQVMQYEVQILDSFGLAGKNNECGAIYSRIAPSVNMCLPPLQWQTYDIDFTNAVHDAKDPKKVTKHARITCKHNGVTVLDNVEIPGPTGGAWNQPEGTPGPLELQGHGNPLQFRNIWIVEKK